MKKKKMKFVFSGQKKIKKKKRRNSFDAHTLTDT